MATPSIRNTFGALEAGAFVGILCAPTPFLRAVLANAPHSLSGIVAMQTYLYYRVYPKDKVHLKCLVRRPLSCPPLGWGEWYGISEISRGAGLYRSRCCGSWTSCTP